MTDMRHNRNGCPSRSDKNWRSHSPGGQAKLEISDHRFDKECLPQDVVPQFGATNGLKRESWQANATSRESASLLDTLGAYVVHEVPLESTARMLQEWERLLADTLAASTATVGDTLASIGEVEWNSLFRLGYEVEEIDLEDDLAEGI